MATVRCRSDWRSVRARSQRVPKTTVYEHQSHCGLRLLHMPSRPSGCSHRATKQDRRSGGVAQSRRMGHRCCYHSSAPLLCCHPHPADWPRDGGGAIPCDDCSRPVLTRLPRGRRTAMLILATLSLNVLFVYFAPSRLSRVEMHAHIGGAAREGSIHRVFGRGHYQWKRR